MQLGTNIICFIIMVTTGLINFFHIYEGFIDRKKCIMCTPFLITGVVFILSLILWWISLLFIIIKLSGE